MGVGGDVVDQPLGDQPEGEAAHLSAEAPDKRAGSDRGEDPGAHNRFEHGAVAVKGRTPLGVGKHDAVSTADDVEQNRVDAAGRGGKGRLDQQPGAAAEPELAKPLGRHVDGADQRDLRAGTNLDRDPLRRQALVQLLDESRDRGGVVGVARAHVRRRHKRARAGRARRARDRERALDRLRAVVDAGQHVAVQVDHLTENLRMSPLAMRPDGSGRRTRGSYAAWARRRSGPSNGRWRRRRSGRSTGPTWLPTARSTNASRVTLKRNTGLRIRSQCLATYRRGRATERILLL